MLELQMIQASLRAPKGQLNSFGGYKYRSCEDILEAVKPHLELHKCLITLTDDIVIISEAKRVYVKATVTMTNKDQKTFSVVAFAREPEEKKGMDASQITGCASSYARKFALSGLLAIDDNADADAMEPEEPPAPEKPKYSKSNIIKAFNEATSLSALNEKWEKAQDTKYSDDPEVLEAYSNCGAELHRIEREGNAQ